MNALLKASDSTAYAVIYADPISRIVKEELPIAPGTTVRQWLAKSGYGEILAVTPMVIMLNAEFCEESRFDEPLRPHDILTLVPNPGLAWFIWMGYAIMAAATAYSLYLSHVNKPASLDDEDRSPTYSLSFRGNHKRPGQPIPVPYGKTRIFFDQGSEPYVEYLNRTDQYLYQYFVVGQGICDVFPESLQYEETPLSAFADVDYQVMHPGVESTLFPLRVNNIEVVSNIELTDEYTPWYQICADTEDASAMLLNFSMPEGIYIVNSKGTYFNHKVPCVLQWREVSVPGTVYDAGPTFTEGWAPYQQTIKIPFGGDHGPDGCYEVRMKRLIADTQDTKVFEKVMWTGLASYLPHGETPQTTRLAIRIRASDQVGNQVLSKFSGVVYRRVRNHDGTSWTAPIQTQNPMLIMMDAITADYGGQLTDAHLDLDVLRYTAWVLDQKRRCNMVVDTQTTLWEVLKEICTCVEGNPVMRDAYIFSLNRDVADKTPVAMFTGRNIVQQSLQITHVGLKEEGIDSVEVEFIDELNGYRENTIMAVPYGGTSNNPERVKVRGLTHWLYAVNYGFRLINAHFYRRTKVEFEAGIEGFIPGYGEVIYVHDYLIGTQDSYGAITGDVFDYNGVNTFTTDQDLSGLSGTFSVFLRNNDGTPQGPLAATKILQLISITEPSWDNSCLTTGSPEDIYQRPVFAAGMASEFIARVLVEQVDQVDRHHVRISGVVDNPNAYIGGDPSVPTELPLPKSLRPLVWNFSGAFFGETGAPHIKLSWEWQNCDHGWLEYTTDNGVTWITVASKIVRQSYTFVPNVTWSALRFRIFGVTIFRGWPVESEDFDPSNYVLTPPPITGLYQPVEFTRDAVIRWDRPDAGHGTYIKVIWGLALKRTETLDNTVTEYRYRNTDSIDDDPQYVNGVPTIKDVARTIIFQLHTINEAGTLSTDYAEILVKNEQISGVTGMEYFERGADVRVTYQEPDARDFAGVEIHFSSIHGFTPSSATQVYSGRNSDILIGGVLQPSSRYYLRAGLFDLWGKDDIDYSNEILIDTGDDVAGGVVTWPGIRDGDGKPEDDSTKTGPFSLIVDPRFSKSNTSGGYGRFWWAWPTTAGQGMWPTGGEDGGPCGLASGTSPSGNYHVAEPRFDVGYGDRIGFKMRAKVEADGFIPGFALIFYDHEGTFLEFVQVKDSPGLSEGSWETLEAVYEVTSTAVRYAYAAFSSDATNISSATCFFDDFHAWVIQPKITPANVTDWIEEGAIGPDELGDISVVHVDTDAGFTYLNIDVPDADWSSWYDLSETTVNFTGREAGQSLLLAMVRARGLDFLGWNAGVMPLCKMDIRVVRDDDPGVYWYVGALDSAWSPNNTFTLWAVSTGVAHYGTDVFSPNRYSSGHNRPELINAIDDDPPDGYVTYKLQFRLFNPGIGSPNQVPAFSYQASNIEWVIMGSRS